MRVAVTGATGFVGAHTVVALLAAGHDVRILARRAELVDEVIGALGVDVDGRLADEMVLGDVTDPDTVGRLLDGCDAVVHAAAVVSVNAADADLVHRTNVEGTRLVLGGAVERGLDPIVHVSSYSALFPSTDPVIGPDSPVAHPTTPYGQSKAEADRYARGLQAAGHPVVTTYPTTVVGPHAGPRAGEAADGWEILVRTGWSMSLRGSLPVVDVRDVAAVHAAAIVAGRGPRRYLCGGTLIPFNEMVDIIEAETGRHIRRIPVAPSVFRAIGWLADRIARLLPIPAVLTHEATLILTRAVPTDDSLTHDELGVMWRPVAETIAVAARATPVPSR